MKRFQLVFGLVLITAMISAQESGPSEPDETDIILPEFLLEVEELGVEEVEAVLPGTGDLALGGISLPLPGADELAVSDIAFDAPINAVAQRTDGPSVFSTGRLGAGTSNRVLGELSIYKLGTDPRFRLGFTHEGVDGYGFNPAGSGFYGFSNTIDAWLSAGNETLGVEATGSFSETENGLQDNSAYNAVSLRQTDARASITYQPDPLVTIDGEVLGSLATRRQTTSGTGTPPRDQEYVLEPMVRATFDIRAVDIIFRSSYFFRALAEGAIPTQQDLDLTAGLEIDLPWSMVVSGFAGINWDFVTGLSYPWDLSIDTLIGDGLELRASGGFRVERYRLAEIWSDEPLMAVGDSVAGELVNNQVWYTTADARWTGAGLSLQSGVEFTSESGTVSMQPYDTTADEYPFLRRQFMSLKPSVRAALQTSPFWQFEAGWNSNMLDRSGEMPAATLDAAVRFNERSGFFRADLEAATELTPAPTMPRLSLAGTITAGDGVEVVVELTDMLSPLMPGGRPVYGAETSAEYPFIEPGFVASIFTRITL